ncbi:hypothetical protein [Streptomyces huiliensis]|uniref:hypothetical protein n=1 Tax=Streptomyces huiliensis TaxID=2876027 RepID=UPI001CBE2EFE|nr:hypothetical protein [Streptomyces huiliensis]MBZ4322492.1 hypothetical protein [Streptomyces huiliensis]
MRRLRLSITHCSGRALILTDTPRPDCDNCGGAGGIASDYGDYDTGEYAGTDWEPCPCWTQWCIRLLPLSRLSRRLRRRGAGRSPWADGYSDEPPF